MFKGKVTRALGAMSGTSLDGVDAAEVLTDGHSVMGFGRTKYRAYTNQERDVLREALGKWNPEDTAEASEIVERVHAQVLSQFHQHEIVGFHGQTVAHDPDNQRTYQIGDGRVLAEFLRKPVVWDFRSADMQFGGQGAPLAPFYHHALARYIGATKPICFLNLGGVANITWVDPNVAHPDDDGALLAFDTGPASAPLNDMMKLRFEKNYDVDGELAARGEVNEQIISNYLRSPYFSKVPPKSLDRLDFEHLIIKVKHLSDEDAAATLTGVIARSVGEGLKHCPSPPSEVLVTGGGRRNKTLMKMLGETLDCPVHKVEDRGLNGDMLEAQAFAYLAVRVAKGLPTSCPTTTGVKAMVSGGTISNPSGSQLTKASEY